MDPQHGVAPLLCPVDVHVFRMYVGPGRPGLGSSLNGTEFWGDVAEGNPTSSPIEHLYDAVVLNLRPNDSEDGLWSLLS